MKKCVSLWMVANEARSARREIFSVNEVGIMECRLSSFTLYLITKWRFIDDEYKE